MPRRAVAWSWRQRFAEAGVEPSPDTLEQYARGTRALLTWANEHGVRVHRLSANDADGFRTALQVQGLPGRPGHVAGDG